MWYIYRSEEKAFDTVDHSILLQKLQNYGIRGVINNWFHSYLTDRVQSTQIKSNTSNKETVSYCFVLGPLLFLIYVNDIYKSSDKLAFYLFADDTNLLYTDLNLPSLENIVKIELNRAYEWLTANRLTLNTKKSNFKPLTKET